MTKSEQRIQAIREETERIYQRIAKSREESDERITKLREEAEERQKQSDARIAKLREETDASIAKIRKKTRKITREARELRKKNDRRSAKLMAKIEKQIRKAKEDTRKAKEDTRKAKELTRQMKDLTRQMKEQTKQIGGYGNKFGALTEALAKPSLKRILKESFNASYEESYSRWSKEHGDVEIDAWGVARNGTTAYLIEIKSRFKPEHLQKVWRHVETFRSLEPEHRDAPVFPILAVVEIDKRHRQLIWESGIYLIDVADGVFELAKPPVEFEPFGHYGAEKSSGMQRTAPSHLYLVPKVVQAGQKD